MDFQHIDSTFSSKSDSILSEIIQRNNLDEIEVYLPLVAVTMYFSRGEISEKEMTDTIKEELRLPEQTAKQITEELRKKIIPTLWNKMPESEKQALLNQTPDIAVRFDNSTPTPLSVTEKILPKIKEETKITPKKNLRLATEPKINKTKILQGPITPEEQKSKGPDKYREQT